MASNLRLGRRAFGGLLLAFAATPSLPVYAQAGPDNRATPVTISESGPYERVAGAAVGAALDRAFGDLDAFSDGIRPEQAREAGFRRRLLELRLLLDLFAFAYEPETLGVFRDAVDDGYERVGGYQDIPVVSSLLQTPFPAEVVTLRQLKMNVALAALRSGTVREAMRAFLGSPPGATYVVASKDVPRIWEMAGQSPTDEFDAVGNAARMGASALAAIQASGPYIADIFDPAQEEHFHDVRKAIRSILLLMQMFPDTRAAIQPIAEPMFQLISQYGDVNDAIVAYRLTLILGADQGAAAEYLRAEFAKAQRRQGVVAEEKTFEGLIAALSQVQDRHRM